MMQITQIANYLNSRKVMIILFLVGLTYLSFLDPETHIIVRPRFEIIGGEEELVLFSSRPESIFKEWSYDNEKIVDKIVGSIAQVCELFLFCCLQRYLFS
jgi:hypothetical protein